MLYFSNTFLTLQILQIMHIDDVVDASPVHFFCGVWGTVAAGIFAEPTNVEMAYGTGSCGLFYKVSGDGRMGKKLAGSRDIGCSILAYL